MRFSYSRVAMWAQCPHRYGLKYVAGVIPDKDYDPQSPLLTGSLLHRLVETDEETAVREYYKEIPVASDESENEVIKALELAKIAKGMLPQGRSEVEVRSGDFIGYIDRLGDDGSIWDLKYSGHPERYKDGTQIRVYAHYLEESSGLTASKMCYLVVPRIHIRLKKGETISEFRQRLRQTAQESRPVIVSIEKDEHKAREFEQKAQEMRKATTFPKNVSRLCEYCEYQTVCMEYDDMMLPKNERRNAESVHKRKIWLYGAPFSGKTYLADKFPNVLMLNTDGNVGFVTAPYVSIKDEITMNGRIAQRKLAWDVLKETIDELEKKQNTYETIVVDLVEDLYEHCRLWSYQKLGIEHESDNSFKAYDFVRTQFLSTMKRLINLDYANIVLISQEDTSRDITKRSGDKTTTIKPNLQDKVALKVAGMVDIVGRVVCEDGEHKIYLKPSETVFGGGRIPLTVTQIPATYEAVETLYKTEARI